MTIHFVGHLPNGGASQHWSEVTASSLIGVDEEGNVIVYQECLSLIDPASGGFPIIEATYTNEFIPDIHYFCRVPHLNSEALKRALLNNALINLEKRQTEQRKTGESIYTEKVIFWMLQVIELTQNELLTIKERKRLKTL